MCFFTLPAIAAEPSAYDVYGKPFYMKQPPGKWVVINYWATWCSACVQEIPDLNKFSQFSRNSNVIFFAVNFDQLSDNLQRDFAKKYGMNYTLLRNNPLRNLVPEEAISSLPMTYVISPQGQVQQLFGVQTAEDLMHMVL